MASSSAPWNASELCLGDHLVVGCASPFQWSKVLDKDNPTGERLRALKLNALVEKSYKDWLTMEQHHAIVIECGWSNDSVQVALIVSASSEHDRVISLSLSEWINSVAGAGANATVRKAVYANSTESVRRREEAVTSQIVGFPQKTYLVNADSPSAIVTRARTIISRHAGLNESQLPKHSSEHIQFWCVWCATGVWPETRDYGYAAFSATVAVPATVGAVSAGPLGAIGLGVVGALVGGGLAARSSVNGFLRRRVRAPLVT